MKTKTFKKKSGLISLLFFIAILVVSCKKDPCKDITCQNGGTPVASGKTCGCDCPTGYAGEFCQIKSDFVKCKINGVDYLSAKMIIDTITENGILYKKILTSGNSSDTEIIEIDFNSALPIGTYQASYVAGMNFYGVYIKKSAFEYYSTKGSITFTNVSDRYEGTFNYVAKDDPTTPSDSVVVTSGSFSIKK